ncbi:hypothetical protein DV711_11555 [Motiliproteus coralliicola]|uniref:Uncharacterized protein n=1 Tax=Motiliproteus coralliicola TaxID=2283196 RepID=A0A369WED9_9GAMM|nr:hypothetical protein [Motiliproteus coralliicola]RDE19519.1 hypothetical protein DV711_11555 [Motiliproteus coralliicola]
MNTNVYTGIANDDRRIEAELQAMGAYDQAQADEPSMLSKALLAVEDFITWMRWKGEVGVYGCRVGAVYARCLESRPA